MPQYILLAGHYRYQLCDGFVYELLSENSGVLVLKNHLGLEQKVFDFSVVARYDSKTVANRVAKKLDKLWKQLEKQQRKCYAEQKRILKEE